MIMLRRFRPLFRWHCNAYSTQPSVKLQPLVQRPVRKKRLQDELNLNQQQQPGTFSILAYSTAEKYNLEALNHGLKALGLYEPNAIENNYDVLHARANISLANEPREVFIFREGSIVLWNIDELESSNLLKFIKSYEVNSYPERIIADEVEIMSYKGQMNDKTSNLTNQGVILVAEDNKQMDKFTFSHAIALSVKLGIWEALLAAYINRIKSLTEDLKMGRKLQLTRDETLRKQGELFALRHEINLSSDLLDVPDFYWDYEDLEVIYKMTCGYFSIAKRTHVMNEKLNHCAELIELISHHLNDKHHVRLEWMIIVLIMVEVGFEMIHYADRFLL